MTGNSEKGSHVTAEKDKLNPSLPSIGTRSLWLPRRRSIESAEADTMLPVASVFGAREIEKV